MSLRPTIVFKTCPAAPTKLICTLQTPAKPHQRIFSLDVILDVACSSRSRFSLLWKPVSEQLNKNANYYLQ